MEGYALPALSLVETTLHEQIIPKMRAYFPEV